MSECQVGGVNFNEECQVGGVNFNVGMSGRRSELQ